MCQNMEFKEQIKMFLKAMQKDRTDGFEIGKNKSCSYKHDFYSYKHKLMSWLGFGWNMLCAAKLFNFGYKQSEI